MRKEFLKKAAALLMSFTMLAGVFSSFASAADYKTAGEIILEDGENTIRADLTEEQLVGAHMYIAQYDADDVMIAVKMAEATKDAVTVSKAANAETAKVFVWKDEGYQPITADILLNEKPASELSFSAIDNAVDLLGKHADDLADELTFGAMTGNTVSVTGTLKYLSNWDGFSAGSSGNYLAYRVSGLNENAVVYLESKQDSDITIGEKTYKTIPAEKFDDKDNKTFTDMISNLSTGTESISVIVSLDGTEAARTEYTIDVSGLKRTQPMTSAAFSTQEGYNRPKVDYKFTAEAKADGANTVVNATYQWQIADTYDGTYTDIPDATSETIYPNTEQIGKFLKCVVTDTTADPPTIELIDGPVEAAVVAQIDDTTYGTVSEAVAAAVTAMSTTEKNGTDVTIKLLADTTLDTAVKINKGDVNNFSNNGAKATLTIEADSPVTVYAKELCVIDIGKGTLKLGNNVTYKPSVLAGKDFGAFTARDSGNIILDGSVIDGFTAEKGSALAVAGNASVTMNSGTIQNCTATVTDTAAQECGIITLRDSKTASFTMNNGTIQNNKADVIIHNWQSTGTAALLGGTISGNSAYTEEGAVADVIALAGTVQVNGTTPVQTMTLGKETKIMTATNPSHPIALTFAEKPAAGWAVVTYDEGEMPKLPDFTVTNEDIALEIDGQKLVVQGEKQYAAYISEDGTEPAGETGHYMTFAEAVTDAVKAMDTTDENGKDMVVTVLDDVSVTALTNINREATNMFTNNGSKATLTIQGAADGVIVSAKNTGVFDISNTKLTLGEHITFQSDGTQNKNFITARGNSVVTLAGAVIDGFTATNGSAAAIVNTAKLVMNSGTIQNCTATRTNLTGEECGIISVRDKSSASAEINGGSFVGNVSDAVIHNQQASDGHISIGNVTFTNNTTYTSREAEEKTAALEVMAIAGTVNVGADTTIDTLTLGAEAKVHVESELATDKVFTLVYTEKPASEAVLVTYADGLTASTDNFKIVDNMFEIEADTSANTIKRAPEAVAKIGETTYTALPEAVGAAITMIKETDNTDVTINILSDAALPSLTKIDTTSTDSHTGSITFVGPETGNATVTCGATGFEVSQNAKVSLAFRGNLTFKYTGTDKNKSFVDDKSSVTITLDGITIDGFVNASGSAVKAGSSSTVVVHKGTVIQNCTATNTLKKADGTVQDSGLIVARDANTVLEVNGCTFNNNKSDVLLQSTKSTKTVTLGNVIATDNQPNTEGAQIIPVAAIAATVKISENTSALFNQMTLGGAAKVEVTSALSTEIKPVTLTYLDEPAPNAAVVTYAAGLSASKEEFVIAENAFTLLVDGQTLKKVTAYITKSGDIMDADTIVCTGTLNEIIASANALSTDTTWKEPIILITGDTTLTNASRAGVDNTNLSSMTLKSDGKKEHTITITGQKDGNKVSVLVKKNLVIGDENDSEGKGLVFTATTDLANSIFSCEASTLTVNKDVRFDGITSKAERVVVDAKAGNAVLKDVAFSNITKSATMTNAQAVLAVRGTKTITVSGCTFTDITSDCYMSIGENGKIALDGATVQEGIKIRHDVVSGKETKLVIKGTLANNIEVSFNTPTVGEVVATCDSEDLATANIGKITVPGAVLGMDAGSKDIKIMALS